MDGTSIAALADEEMAKAEQAVWPKGEISRRLQALGFSSRGFADETGVHESTMRRIDSGERLLRRDLIEQRERVMAWIELEEKLRLANPIPVWPGREPVGVSAKHRRRPNPGPRRVSDTSEDMPAVAVVRGPVPEGLAEAVAEQRGGALISDASEVPPGFVRLVLPSPDLPSLDLADDAPVDQRVVRLVVECVGKSPKRIADMMGAPAVNRTLRRWLAGADPTKHPIRAESAAWLRDVLGVVRAQPPEVVAWVRYRYLMQAWRSEAKPEERAVLDAAIAVMSSRPPAGLDVFEDVVAEALLRRPDKLAAYQGRGEAEEVEEDRRGAVPAGRSLGPSALELAEASRLLVQEVVPPPGLAGERRAQQMIQGALRRTYRQGVPVDAWVRDAAAWLTRDEAERAVPVAETDDPSVVPGVSVRTFYDAVRRVLKWIVDDGSLDDLPADDPAHEDARAALRETHRPGMTLDAWVAAAQARLEATGYSLEDGDEGGGPDAPPAEAVVVSDRRGQAEARPRQGEPRKPLVDLTRGRG